MISVAWLSFSSTSLAGPAMKYKKAPKRGGNSQGESPSNLVVDLQIWYEGDVKEDITHFANKRHNTLCPLLAVSLQDLVRHGRIAEGTEVAYVFKQEMYKGTMTSDGIQATYNQEVVPTMIICLPFYHSCIFKLMFCLRTGVQMSYSIHICCMEEDQALETRNYSPPQWLGCSENNWQEQQANLAEGAQGWIGRSANFPMCRAFNTIIASSASNQTYSSAACTASWFTRFDFQVCFCRWLCQAEECPRPKIRCLRLWDIARLRRAS